MKLIIYSLACLLLVLAIVMSLPGSGQVILAFSDLAIQTSLGAFVFILVIGFILFYSAVRMVIGLIDIPDNYRRRRKLSRQGKSEYYLTQGWLALTEGNWESAEKLFTKGATYSRLPMINYIGAARAAQQLGKIDKRDHYLSLACTTGADPEYAVAIAQAELQLDQQQTEQAYATLKHLDSNRPGTDKVMQLFLQASTRLKDWRQSLALLEGLEKKGLLAAEKIWANQLHTYAAVLTDAAGSGNVQDLDEVWNTIPKKLKKEPYLLGVYVSLRLRYPDTSDCESLLRQAIKEKLDPALVRLYGLVQGKDPGKQLAFIEQLLSGNDRDAVLQLTAGRLYKRQQLWGKARTCLEASIKAGPTAEAYHELATMFESQGDTQGAQEYFRKGLALANDTSN